MTATTTQIAWKTNPASSTRCPGTGPIVARRYAVNASGNWRITFGWTEGDAIDADLEDYH